MEIAMLQNLIAAGFIGALAGMIVTGIKLSALSDFEFTNGPLRQVTYDTFRKYKPCPTSDTVMVRVTLLHKSDEIDAFFKAPLFFSYIARSKQKALLARVMRSEGVSYERILKIAM